MRILNKLGRKWEKILLKGFFRRVDKLKQMGNGDWEFYYCGLGGD